MNKPLFCLLLAVFVLSCSTIQGQKFNTVQFIDPNISVAYDSNYIKVVQRYSNTAYETESFDYLVKRDSSSEIKIHLKADHPGNNPGRRVIDSILLLNMTKMKGVDDKDFKVVHVETSVRHIHGFSCIGFVGYDKERKINIARIGGFHLSANDRTEITYMAKDAQDLEKEYVTLSTFLSQFRSYSKEEIEKEEELIRNKYTVVVRPAPSVFEPFRPKTYSGIVSVEQPLEHKVAEVRLAMTTLSGWEIFKPDDRGQVPIICYDKEQGEVERKGELVLLNSFGKKVKLPFTFTYTNTGELR
jgi:hypothetical protein